MSEQVRCAKLLPADLDPAQRDLYQSILGGPRAHQTNSVPLVDASGCLEGPFNAFLLQPVVGQSLQALGSSLRYSTRLPDRAREIAILVVAAHTDAAFERYAHEPIAKSLGLTSSEVTDLRAGDFDNLAPDDAVIARATSEMLTRVDLADESFGDLQGRIGTEQIFELTALVGYYYLLALQLRVFRVSLPDAAPGDPSSELLT